MNMTQFTKQQLNVMANENSPRGMSARKELERRSKQQEAVAETPVQEEIEQEDASTQEEKPKRNTRRKPAVKKSEED